jgi:hypothetical protein
LGRLAKTLAADSRAGEVESALGAGVPDVAGASDLATGAEADRQSSEPSGCTGRTRGSLGARDRGGATDRRPSAARIEAPDGHAHPRLDGADPRLETLRRRLEEQGIGA